MFRWESADICQELRLKRKTLILRRISGPRSCTISLVVRCVKLYLVPHDCIYRIPASFDSEARPIRLGLEAQREAVRKFVTAYDCIHGEYVEVESGKNADRPKLKAAIERCRLMGATLLIAKLDRLSRKVSFLSALMDSDVPFVAADNPHATRFTLHILAAVAEHEALAISERTKAALAAAKARGKKLGGWRGRHLTAAERARGTAIRVRKAKARAKQIVPVLDELRAAGQVTLRDLADGLNARGIRAARGGRWVASQVRAVMRAVRQ
jgi:DNA invertase Pin-like site-specific DNA recombinase